MRPHVCPWWGGYFIDNRFRRWLHNPERILGPHARPGLNALDFGCGMGFFSIALARMLGDGGRVTAVDLQQRMLDVLARRAERAGVGDRIRTHCCPADSVALDESQTFDFALAFYAAHEAPDVPRLLGELHDLLRAGGKLLLVEPIGHVTKAHFQYMLDAATRAGLQTADRPRIRLSHAAVLRK